MPLARGQTLIASGEEVSHLLLPESGLVSLLLELPDGTATEVGLVGREGIVGLPALLGEPVSPFRAVVRVPGQAQRISVAELRLLADRSANLRDLIRRQALAALLQAATNAACHAAHPLDRRAARWLLAAADRVGPGFPLTQEELAVSLGARRPTVNGVLSAFRDAGLIRQSRGQVAVADPAGLEARSCACLAAPGGMLRRTTAPGGAARPAADGPARAPRDDPPEG